MNTISLHKANWTRMSKVEELAIEGNNPRTVYIRTITVSDERGGTTQIVVYSESPEFLTFND